MLAPLTPEQKDLVNQYITEAEKCAKRWRKQDKSISYEDFFQEAVIGLISAIQNYNSKHKKSFKSYAYLRMNGYIKNMRAIWYTGKKEGFTRNYPLIIFTKSSLLTVKNNIQDEDETQKDIVEKEWFENDWELREQIKEIEIEDNNTNEINKQKKISNILARIKTKMKNKNISMTTLAKKIGVSQPTISRWLSNTNGLSEKSISLIIKTLEINIEGDY